MQKKNIFLIGFMGTGKTSFGKKVAKSLGRTFLDTDQLIEEKFDRSIATYFQEKGEESFRCEEHEVIKTLFQKYDNAIVSVGGGLPCYHDNMKLMNENGITIYLHRPAKELMNRLRNSKTDRPLIRGMADEELLGFIQNLLAEREEFYLKSTLILNREEQNVETLKAKINNL